MLLDDHEVWRWTYEDLTVCEVEHLFGFDVILFRTLSAGVTIPIGIITRDRPMDEIDKHHARQWAMYRSLEDYARVSRAMQSLEYRND